jgi:hypothetical protein
MDLAMSGTDTIAQLQADARIYGRCPTCEEDFPLKQAILFYADAPLPDAARTRIVDEWRAKHPDQLRSKEDIDRYLAEERASWGDDER